MFGLKKQFIKNMIKLEVVENIPDELKLYIAQVRQIEEDYKRHESYAEEAIKTLKGIEKVNVDYDKGVVTIKYDPKIVSVQRVYKWLQRMIDIGLDYYDELKGTWKTDGDQDQNVKVVWEKMKPVLEAQVKSV